MLHIRYQGRSIDLSEQDLTVDRAMNDNEIKEIIARYLEIDKVRLNGYFVDRPANGNIVVRPEAVYG